MIKIKDYELFKEIGKGNFGVVYLTKKKNYQNLFSTKVIDMTKMNELMLNYLQNEIDIMIELSSHPNIVTIFDVIKSQTHCYVVMEYCNGGSLEECLERYGKPFPIIIIQHFMRQIVSGVRFMHSRKIMHRDIKLENILVNFKTEEDKNKLNLLSSEVKIIDFGLSKKLGTNEVAYTIVGSPINMDPLILKKFNKPEKIKQLEGYNEKADIWSLGTICYEMLTNQKLFNVDNLEELLSKIEKGNYAIPTNIQLSNEIISFLNGMLQYEGELRLSAELLSQHEFLVKNVKNFVNVQLSKISKKVEGKNIIINIKSNTTIREVFDKNSKVDWEIYINGLLKEYKEAENYFKENNLTNQEKKANNLCAQIKKIKAEFEKGRTTDLISLPKPVIPEFIYGCTAEHRNQRFNEIYSKNINLKNQIESTLNSLKYSNYQGNPELKQKYERNMAILKRINENIMNIQNNYQNIWVRAPDIIKGPNQNIANNNNISKINNNSNSISNQIKIIVKRVDNIKENLNLFISIRINEKRRINQDVNLKAEKGFNQDLLFQLNGEDYKYVDHFILEISNNSNFNRPKSNAVNIGEIKFGKPITFNFLMSEDKMEMVNLIISFIKPKLSIKSSVSFDNLDILNIKFYPPFNGKNSATEKIKNLLK
jgi:serine/threonine protein kinase